jgi:type I restriction enzyme S subunit
LQGLEQGWSPACENRPADDHEWGVLKVGCVNGASFDPWENKALPLDLVPVREYEIKPRDVLMSRANTRELLGSTAIVTQVRPRLLLCDKLYRLRVQPTVVDPTFLVYVVGSRAVRFQLERDATGTSGSMQNIAQSTVRNLVISLPPVAEQQAIAAYLDCETTRIDALVANKERLVALLEEKRAALISQAVTRGFDQTAPLKDSGVPWLGQVPAHWQVLRLKDCLRAIEQGWSPACENRLAEDHEWGVLKVGCVNGASFNAEENKALPSNLSPLREYEIKPGDVIMSRANTRELLGSASLVEHVRPRLLLCDKLYRLRVQPTLISPAFLVYTVASSTVRFQLERDATGASSSMQNIAQSTVRNLIILLPPVAEQGAIVRSIQQESTTIDNLIAKVRIHIDRLREHRTALISAAVTGQIDVREVAG